LAATTSLKKVQLLTEKLPGAEYINRQNAFGNSALHEAAIMGQEDVVVYLIKNGANVSLPAGLFLCRIEEHYLFM
jgi:ankyrin repeat protein